MLTAPLSLKHQELLENKFRSLSIPFSEYSFANLYLFRNIHHFELIVCDAEHFIKGIMRDGTPFIVLTSPPTKTVISIVLKLISADTCLFPIPEQWLPQLKEVTLQAVVKDEDNDYLFSRDKLIHYPGRHLSKKRNLVKQLLEGYSIKTETLTKALANDALTVLEKWHQEHLSESPKDDYESCYEGLKLFDQLNLNGRIIYVDDLPDGFTLGERMSTEYYALHFCKASPLIKGIYQQLYKDIAECQDEKCLWINLEQDLGLPSLRQAKHSYIPDILLRKWRIFLKPTS
jgi:hypothetical protein